MPTKSALLWLAFFLVAASPLAWAFESTATIINSLPAFTELNLTPDHDSSTAAMHVDRPSSGSKSINIAFNPSDLNGYLEVNNSTHRCSPSI